MGSTNMKRFLVCDCKTYSFMYKYFDFIAKVYTRDKHWNLVAIPLTKKV